MSERLEENRELLDALEALNSRRTGEVVQRTRRNVMEAARRMQEARAERRQRLGIALLVVLVSLVLVTPMIWSFCETEFGGDAITNVSILVLTMFVVILSTAMGVLLSRVRRRGVRE